MVLVASPKRLALPLETPPQTLVDVLARVTPKVKRTRQSGLEMMETAIPPFPLRLARRDLQSKQKFAQVGEQQ